MSFLDPIMPSAVVADKLSASDLLAALQAEYGKAGDFAQYVDSQANSIASIADKLYRLIISSYDEVGTYEASLTDVIEYATQGTGLDASQVSALLRDAVADLELSNRMAASVPLTKLDKLPAGTRIDLADSTALDTDYRGVSVASGYLTPDQYFSEIAYPGMGSTAENLPSSIVKSISEGYSGYGTLQPLDDLLRPGLANILSRSDLGQRITPAAIAGIGTLDTLRDITGLGSMPEADRAMYDVEDIASLVVDMNGYTVYDPLTANRTVPAAENADSGLPTSVRTRTTPF